MTDNYIRRAKPNILLSVTLKYPELNAAKTITEKRAKQQRKSCLFRFFASSRVNSFYA